MICFVLRLSISLVRAVQAWDAMNMNMNGMQMYLQQEMRAFEGRDALVPGAVRRAFLANCPNCGQQNLKEQNNNYITCWACTRSFCFLCRKMIKGTSHFSRQGCRQHST